MIKSRIFAFLSKRKILTSKHLVTLLDVEQTIIDLSEVKTLVSDGSCHDHVCHEFRSRVANWREMSQFDYSQSFRFVSDLFSDHL